MLFRKIRVKIADFLKSDANKILIVEGARQTGKTYIIRSVGKELFPNFIEVNLLEDSLKDRLFADARTPVDFYLQLSVLAGNRMKAKENTLVFLDEIQAYPHLLTLLKFLKEENRFTYIASGSLLGVTLAETTSVPMGSVELLKMHPLDFEEFLYANGVGEMAVRALKKKFEARESLEESLHNKMMDLFKKYLLVGGLPDAVNSYVAEHNIVKVRKIHEDIHHFYAIDAAKYDKERKLKIGRVYEMIPSTLENKKKRIVIQKIENKKGKRSADYADEFEYLIHSGIALDVKAISAPVFPLIESSGKNLMKLYLNDPGILTGILYRTNVNAILNDVKSINLGSVYECAVACELSAHGHELYYYDNRDKGEVDYLIDDYDNLSVAPLEIKSGKDYMVYSALSRFVNDKNYQIQHAFVLSNEREIKQIGKIVYLPVYFAMFF